MLPPRKKKVTPPHSGRTRRPTGPGREPLGDVQGLLLPDLFCRLWDEGAWGQPADERLYALMPWLNGPVDFIMSFTAIWSASYGKLADIPTASIQFQEYRSSRSKQDLDLPWLDVDQSVMIGHNRHIGDDLGIALDYRSGCTDPRVVASKWIGTANKRFHHIDWVVIADSFSQFVDHLEIAK